MSLMLVILISRSQMLPLRRFVNPALRILATTLNSISFMPAGASTSGHVHCELVRTWFLQAHRETVNLFAASRYPHAQPGQDLFRFRSAAFYSGLKSKAGLLIAKAFALRVNLNVDGCPISSRAVAPFPLPDIPASSPPPSPSTPPFSAPPTV